MKIKYRLFKTLRNPEKNKIKAEFVKLIKAANIKHNEAMLKKDEEIQKLKERLESERKK